MSTGMQRTIITLVYMLLFNSSRFYQWRYHKETHEHDWLSCWQQISVKFNFGCLWNLLQYYKLPYQNECNVGRESTVFQERHSPYNIPLSEMETVFIAFLWTLTNIVASFFCALHILLTFLWTGFGSQYHTCFQWVERSPIGIEKVSACLYF